MLFLVVLFDLWSGIRTVFISAAGAYVIAAKIDGPWMPWIGFVFLMGHMSINHLYRQFANDASVVDITGTRRTLLGNLFADLSTGVQMVLIMKVSDSLRAN